MNATATTTSIHWERFLALSRDADGWWLNAEALCTGEPLWGPYATKSEAIEARRSYLRDAISKPWIAKKGR